MIPHSHWHQLFANKADAGDLPVAWSSEVRSSLVSLQGCRSMIAGSATCASLLCYSLCFWREKRFASLSFAEHTS